MNFDTKAVHAGVTPDVETGAIMTPIYQTSTFVQSSPGHHKGYEYARTHNPTRTALESCVAELENGNEALCFSSGMAAIDAVCRLLKAGDEVLATSDLYGGTYRLFTKVYANYGIKFTFLDMQDVRETENRITENTRLVWIETPTNPTLKIINLEAHAKLCSVKGILLAVDNTFASPCLQNPLNLGAHIVIHSATKYLGGHSDVIMGAVVTKDAELHKQLSFFQNACGAVPGPQDCFLVLRGIKTLALRMKRHSENGRQIATYLAQHLKIQSVNWPGFPDHPNYDVAKAQMKDFGGMLSFVLKEDSMEKAFRLCSATRLFSLAESLGGVESLIGHPASMTHASIPKDERLKAGINDSLLRLSVGIEDAKDLLEDLDKALDQI